jgi:cytochrome c-type biogenesis protein
MEKVMGVLLVVTGIAFLNVFDWLSINAFGQWMIETFPGLTTVEEKFTPADLQREIMNQRPSP